MRIALFLICTLLACDDADAPGRLDAAPPQDLGADRARVEDAVSVPPPDVQVAVDATPDAAVAPPDLGFDPSQNDAITAYGHCAQLVLDCVEAQGLDDACVEGVRVCATDRPWEEDEWCCARDCVERYQARRAIGEEIFSAVLAVFRDERDCMPGVPGRVP